MLACSHQQDLAVDDLVKLVPGHSPHFEEVLRGCLQSKPEDRLSPVELLELEWFRRFREPQPAPADGEEGERPPAGGSGGGGIAPAGGVAEGEDGEGKGAEQRSPENIAGGGLGGEEEAAAAVEEHSDLDQAARVVREYIVRAVEGGVLAGGGANRDSPCVGLGSGGSGGRRRSSENGMIQTMRRWDIDARLCPRCSSGVPPQVRDGVGGGGWGEG